MANGQQLRNVTLVLGLRGHEGKLGIVAPALRTRSERSKSGDLRARGHKLRRSAVFAAHERIFRHDDSLLAPAGHSAPTVKANRYRQVPLLDLHARAPE